MFCQDVLEYYLVKITNDFKIKMVRSSDDQDFLR